MKYENGLQSISNFFFFFSFFIMVISSQYYLVSTFKNSNWFLATNFHHFQSILTFIPSPTDKHLKSLLSFFFSFFFRKRKNKKKVNCQPTHESLLLIQNNINESFNWVQFFLSFFIVVGYYFSLDK